MRLQFRTFLAYGLFRDLAYLYDRPGQGVHTLIALGRQVCGHPGLVHGGISATVSLPMPTYQCPPANAHLPMPTLHCNWILHRRAEASGARLQNGSIRCRSTGGVSVSWHVAAALIRISWDRGLACFADGILVRMATSCEWQSLTPPEACCDNPGLQICDETLGALAYMLKRDGALPAGLAYTARLEVDYKKVPTKP